MPDLDLPSLLLIAIGLSADCFAVALGISIPRATLSFLPALRVSIFFGGFQLLMCALGWLAGSTVVEYIAAYDHWLAFILLAAVGGRMVRESFRGEKETRSGPDATRGFLLVMLSIATSIDSLAAGLTFAFLRTDIIIASSIIGVVAFIVTLLAFFLGRKAGDLVGRRAEMIGGIVLIGIGLRIVLESIL